MKKMLFAMVKFFIGKGLKFSRKHSMYYWEALQDLPAGVIYRVIGLAPYNPMSSYRPMWIAREDQMYGPRVLHNSFYVDMRMVMFKTKEFTTKFIGLGDIIYRDGDEIKVIQEKVK